MLESNPKHVILAVRNLQKDNKPMRQLNAIKGASTNIVLRELDQFSCDSVNPFVRDLAGEPVNIVILKAG